MSSQRVPITSSSLQSLNNQSLLRGNNACITSTSSHFRNGRSQSPVPNRGGSDGGLSQQGTRSPTPSREDVNRTQEPRAAEILSRPLSTGELAFFDTMATNARLDTAHRGYAQFHAEVYGNMRQHIALSVGLASCVFNVSNLSTRIDRLSGKLDTLIGLVETQNQTLSQNRLNVPSGTASVPWTCSPELHVGLIILFCFPSPNIYHLTISTLSQEMINELATKLIRLPNLESYTALEMNNIVIARSLFNTIKTRINQQNTSWLDQHLPARVQGVHDTVGTRAYATCIKNACKHSREQLHYLLLTGIHDPKTGEVLDTPVPTIKTLWHRIPQPVHGSRIWGSSSIWACADKHLNSLRAKGNDFTVMFYKIVYNQDLEVFNGRNFFSDLRENCEFKLPSDEVVQTAIDEE
ncbi:uncharacterized protein MELLADRAFT_61253 [Melampsora larici-populina 98AG31]|uniref:Uncharacterized protein n=1 Tax=Melampsora larici-populina (strain 98AG31 / pathotype 3-4-7) TaxID=747676 RepID=F4RE76_MELLP|nr:uncharacterized protein MELLADRAFT_61253 [Melampsora larici-populina 98AG31]EGG09044.1 hypothetical protein MELLADRAFT_61253 [Melampsora larici-populina 98AG31]